MSDRPPVEFSLSPETSYESLSISHLQRRGEGGGEGGGEGMWAGILCIIILTLFSDSQAIFMAVCDFHCLNQFYTICSFFCR